jgi:hypothetical protein
MFKDPIAPKQCKIDKNTRYTEKFQEKGENYGTGFNVPVGSFGQAKNSKSVIPSGVKEMDVRDAKIYT